jgi:enoyl-CoA hydratase
LPAETSYLTPDTQSEIINSSGLCAVEWHGRSAVLRLVSDDGTNRLSIARMRALTNEIRDLAEQHPAKLIITGNAHFFSAGAELAEINALAGTEAFRFARMGQQLMNAVAAFPAPTIAAIHGFCMGGGLDLALACERRLAGHHAAFGHRGAALGLVTGWGGTQRLPRIVGKARALEMFLAAEKLSAKRALEFDLVEAVVGDPLASALEPCNT